MFLIIQDPPQPFDIRSFTLLQQAFAILQLFNPEITDFNELCRHLWFDRIDFATPFLTTFEPYIYECEAWIGSWVKASYESISVDEEVEEDMGTSGVWADSPP